MNTWRISKITELSNPVCSECTQWLCKWSWNGFW
nr:MAG TPA: hypothetical protein [Caudoviricetes sp.]